jgi:hypothetical protein
MAKSDKKKRSYLGNINCENQLSFKSNHQKGIFNKKMCKSDEIENIRKRFFRNYLNLAQQNGLTIKKYVYDDDDEQCENSENVKMIEVPCRLEDMWKDMLHDKKKSYKIYDSKYFNDDEKIEIVKKPPIQKIV